EEVALEIGGHVHLLVTDKDPIAAIGEHLVAGGVGIERAPVLIEEGDARPAAEHHLAARGRKLARDHAQERGLAGAVWPDDAPALALHEDEREVVDEHALPEGDAHVLELEDGLREALGLGPHELRPPAAAAL